MKIQSFKPEYSLLNFIKYYWVISGNYKISSHKKILLPYSESCLIFLITNNKNSTGIYLCPPNIKPHEWYFSPSFDMKMNDEFFYVDISFYPGVLHELFKIPFNKLDNRAYSIDELSIKIDKSILDRLYDNRNNQYEIQNILNRYFFQFFYNFSENEFLSNIRNLHFNCQLDEFYNNSKLSIRQVQRDMNRFTGLNARTIQRISRFYKLLNCIKEQNYKSLAFISQDLEFYDQSHLLKELKYFTGVSLKDFIDNSSKYLQFQMKELT